MLGKVTALVAKQTLLRKHSCAWLRTGKVMALFIKLKLQSLCAAVYQPAAPYV